MNKVIVTIFLLLVCIPANADVFVLINSSTLDVQDISIRDDAVIEEGFEKIVLKGSISDYALNEKAQNYKFIDGKFIYNSEKINAEYQAKEDAKKVKEDMKAIKVQMEKMAYDALIEEKHEFQKLKKEDLK